jgi:hypothetical protein
LMQKIMLELPLQQALLHKATRKTNNLFFQIDKSRRIET